MKRQNWVALVGLVAALLAALVGQVGAAGGDAVAPGFRPGTSLEASKENSTSKANSPGGSAVVPGEFGDPGASRSGSGVVGWLQDHGKGLLYGVAVGAAVAVGVVVVGALVTLSAPVIAVAAVGALVAGGLYGLFTGAARFNVWEAVVYSSIGAVSAGVGQGLAALSLAGRGLMAARAGIDVLGGGLATTASYLLHEAHPTWGGAATAFGLGAVTAGVFMGLGFGVVKVLGQVKIALGFRGALNVSTPLMAGGEPTWAAVARPGMQREAVAAGGVAMLDSNPAVLQRAAGAVIAQTDAAMASRSVATAELKVAVGAKSVSSEAFQGIAQPFVQSKPSSTKLGQNMVAQGIQRPAETAAHHIVAGGHTRAMPARKVLERVRIDINDADNGVFLPATTTSPAPGHYHPSLHRRRYFNAVNTLLQRATTKQDVLDALEYIRDECLKGTFPR